MAKPPLGHCPPPPASPPGRPENQNSYRAEEEFDRKNTSCKIENFEFLSSNEGAIIILTVTIAINFIDNIMLMFTNLFEKYTCA